MNNSLVKNHVHRNVGEQVQKRINGLKIGEKMQDLPEELWHESFRFYMNDPNRKGGPNLRLLRLDPKKPSLTVTGFIFNKFVHPYENRFLTVREAARLQDFPDDLAFEGSLSSTQQQVGNAVPTKLAKAVLQTLLQTLVKGGAITESNIPALSLFSGAGGFDLGAEQANYLNTKIDVKLCTDYWLDACATLSGYFKGRIPVIQQDITGIEDPVSFYQTHTNTATLPELIYGGPPCQSFSQAGKQKGVMDLRGNLVFEFLRFIQVFQPKAFVMENVSNIKGVGEGQISNQLLRSFQEIGYHVKAKILTASDYGSPQLRRRMFFIGIRQELEITPVFPTPTHTSLPSLLELPYYTVGEAFANLPVALPNKVIYKDECELVS